MKQLIASLLAAACLALPALHSAPAEAGSFQAEAPALPIEDVRAFARSVEEDLAARGAHAAIVSRVGRPPEDLPQGIRYTHVGLWVLSQIEDADGAVTRGYRVWNLYQRAEDPAVSDLVQDSPVEFFAGAQRLRAGIIVPKPQLQERLVGVLMNGTWEAVHNPSYSVLANPDNNRYQNCTEHLLNAVMAAVYETDDMGRIKANTAAHFEPQPVRLSPMERTFGPVFVAGVATDDHSGPLATATFGSIARFFEQHRLSAMTYNLQHVGS